MTGMTTVTGSVNGVAKSLLVASDSGGDLAAAHVLVDQNGNPYGVQGNQFVVKTGAVTPAAGAAYKITTGGQPVTMVTGPVNGCQITNPLSAADQGISAAEVAYLNPVTAAGTTGNNTNFTLQPGQSWTSPGPLAAGVNISVNAATANHSFSVLVW